jgi:hypothetical protein
VLVCELHDTRWRTCFQRLSNNADPGGVTDHELVTIYWFAHLHGHFEKKAMHQFIRAYWQSFFPRLLSDQTFVARLNRLEPTFHSLGAGLQGRLRVSRLPELDQVIDFLPVMLARGGHAYAATVARATADVGYCASKKQYFYGVRLHAIARRLSGYLPCPQQIWLREASCHNVRSVKEQAPPLPQATLLADSAYAEGALQAQLAAQGTALHTPKRKPKCTELTPGERPYNRCLSRL